MFHLNIRTKFTLAFVGIALAITTIAFAAMLLSFRAGFLQYVNNNRIASLAILASIIQEEVKAPEDWKQLSVSRRAWHNLLRELRRSPEVALLESPPKKNNNPKSFLLLNKDKRPIHGKFKNINQLALQAIIIDEKIIGYVATRKLSGFSKHADKLFVAKQTQYFIIILLLTGVIAIASALLMAQWMTAPIQRLHSGMKELMRRNYDERINHHGNDEIGTLVQSFNRLANTLAQHEKSQQRWIADISHELRTPLSTLRGEIEALQDGVRELTMMRVQSLHEEVLHLQRMVEDLHQLALSDLGAMRYQFSPIKISALMEKLFTHHQRVLEDQAIRYQWQIVGDEQAIQADSDRLYQLFNNLLQNSLRYTDSPGEIKITITFDSTDKLIITWEDSAPGVSIESVDLLFDRLYREEKSRNRERGGSGLGLSICKAIIDAHQGSIAAQTSGLGGLMIKIILPRAL